jgi:two-component system, NarL family, sensor kinase
MNRRALESSDAERRRIAAGLHDGVVQQLVASSLDLAGRAERANAEGDPTRAADLGAAATTIRSSIAGLRSLLVEIYPPNVAAAGLPAALRDLASTLAAGDLPVVLDLDDVAAARLSPEQSESFFRVSQEVLRNAAKHAAPSVVSLRVYAEDDWVYLAIDDDGVGFDAAAASREASLRAGHLGLQLIIDAARQGDAQLCLASQIGSGTHYRMAVAAS